MGLGARALVVVSRGDGGTVSPSYEGVFFYKNYKVQAALDGALYVP